MEYKKRKANFEILRVIAIIMVLILHYLSQTGNLLEVGVSPSSRQITGQFIESFCIVAVNVWVLISGYFLSKSAFKLTRILQLLAQVYFYTILVTIVMQIAGTASVEETDRIYKTTQYLFPISSEHYSFATAYILLYVIAPVLNKGVLYMTRKQIKYTIIGLLVWFCIIKSIVPVIFPTDMFGYNLDWYICLYLIAAYIRKYNVRILTGFGTSALLFIVSGLGNFAVSMVFHRINLTSGRFTYFATVPAHYNFILCLTGALGLFSMFRYMKVSENAFTKAARVLAPFSFGVYLLHEHIEIRDRWVTWLSGLGIVGEASPSAFGMVFHMIRCVLILFVCCIFVDFIRSQIFEFVRRVLSGTRLFKWFGIIDAELAVDKEK